MLSHGGLQTGESGDEATRRYSAARAELPGRPGQDRRRALVSLTDEWLRTLFRLAGGEQRQAALVAVGGYGHGDLAVGSDLDLVLLHSGDAPDFAERIWYPIWGSRIDLDHSVRTVSEARRMAASDLKVMLGLLDARTIAGDERLVAQMLDSVLADWRRSAAKRMSELKALVDARRQRCGEVAHMLEPDLKEGYGGLRDLVVLRAIAASWLTDMPHEELRQPAALLMDSRDALHLRTGKSGDRLLMQEQDGVAYMLGAADSDGFMRGVSAAGRTIAHAADSTWYRVSRVTRKSSRRSERRPLADGVVVQDGEVVLAVGARPEHDPVLVLRAAAAAAQAGLALAPHAVSRLVAESAPMPVPWPPAARDSFVSLLGAGQSTVGVWEALDQAGIVSALIPEWSPVRSAPQRNPVHRFTVDRHLVETAVQAAAFQREVARPDLLLVSALLHDIGKGRNSLDHTATGFELVTRIAPELGFDAADSAVLVELVRNHLLLAETATRRDLADPATIATVTQAVGDTDGLDLLYALTRADGLATGPVAWSEWRAALVADLVARTRAALADGAVTAAPEVSERARALLRSSDLDIAVDDVAPGDLIAVTAVAPDRAGLLAVVAGILAINRLDVRSARASGEGDMAVSEWTVDPVFGDAPDAEKLRADVRQALDGQINIADRLERREEAYPVSRQISLEPKVTVVPEASARATVVEVRTYDRPGTLFRLAWAITGAGANIAAARADSLGSSVVDVFYLTGAEGRPLSGDALDAVVAKLAAIVES
ncbi:MAG: [protein-PII] uridylyltransferase [Candidatus Nanopelagicales bacterium]|nr:[protein-PII] uridylyltransferase [Candidatus Nanopelagicales bacterium]MDZ4248480.1 [protein-PII] uridylyltransferase [Candidatus Nanopelagicales bacterium]